MHTSVLSRMRDPLPAIAKLVLQWQVYWPFAVNPAARWGRLGTGQPGAGMPCARV